MCELEFVLTGSSADDEAETRDVLGFLREIDVASTCNDDTRDVVSSLKASDDPCSIGGGGGSGSATSAAEDKAVEKLSCDSPACECGRLGVRAENGMSSMRGASWYSHDCD